MAHVDGHHCPLEVTTIANPICDSAHSGFSSPPYRTPQCGHHTTRVMCPWHRVVLYHNMVWLVPLPFSLSHQPKVPALVHGEGLLFPWISIVDCLHWFTSLMSSLQIYDCVCSSYPWPMVLALKLAFVVDWHVFAIGFSALLLIALSMVPSNHMLSEFIVAGPPSFKAFSP